MQTPLFTRVWRDSSANLPVGTNICVVQHIIQAFIQFLATSANPRELRYAASCIKQTISACMYAGYNGDQELKRQVEQRSNPQAKHLAIDISMLRYVCALSQGIVIYTRDWFESLLFKLTSLRLYASPGYHLHHNLNTPKPFGNSGC